MRLWGATVAAATAVLLVGSCGDQDGNDAGETLPPIITTTTTSTTVAPTTTMARSYEVQSGDTLTGIAEKVGVPITDLMRANRITDPNDIQAGQVLQLPSPEIPTSPPASGDAVATTSTTLP